MAVVGKTLFATILLEYKVIALENQQFSARSEIGIEICPDLPVFRFFLFRDSGAGPRENTEIRILILYSISGMGKRKAFDFLFRIFSAENGKWKTEFRGKRNALPIPG